MEDKNKKQQPVPDYGLRPEDALWGILYPEGLDGLPAVDQDNEEEDK